VSAQGALTPVAGSPFVPSVGVDTVALSGGRASCTPTATAPVLRLLGLGRRGLVLVAGSPFTPGAFNIMIRPGHDQLFAVRDPSIHVWALDRPPARPRIGGSPFTADTPTGLCERWPSPPTAAAHLEPGAGYIFATASCHPACPRRWPARRSTSPA
jgi:hypothetical protein